MPAKHARKATNAVTEEEQEENNLPVDNDVLRAKIAKRLSIIVSNLQRRWCSCAEPSCKRARACCAPKGDCSNRKPLNKPLSERHLARSRAQLARMLANLDLDDRERQRPSAEKSHQKS